MTKEIAILDAPELQSIEKSKAEQIKKTFEPMVQMLKEFEEAYNSVITEANEEITKEVTNKAKRLRIDIGKVRIETEKIRKDQKEEYLRAGKAIDGVSNILKWAVTDKENKLKEIENFFEIQEQKRLEALQLERAEKLSKYIEDAHERNLSIMEEDVWNVYFQSKKKEYEDRLEAEKQAELDRIEKERLDNLEQKRKLEIAPYLQFLNESKDFRNLSEKDYTKILKDCKQAKIEYDKEQEKIRLENERLKKEAEAKEKQRLVEEKTRKEKEEVERKIREEKERKERETYEAKLKAEREEKERIEKELKAKQEDELKAKQEEEARLQAELNKGDADKVKDLLSDLESLKTKYSFKSAKNQKMYKDVGILIDKIINYINV